MTKQISKCTAGEVCAVQPIISIVYYGTSNIDYNFEGTVFVNIQSSPTGYEHLYYGDGCTELSCEQEVSGGFSTVVINEGVASFDVRSSFVLKYLVDVRLRVTLRDCTSSKRDRAIG